MLFRSRVCKCKKKHHQRTDIPQFQTFNCIEWLKSHVPENRLTDRTVKIKYLVHPAEMNEHKAVKKVFQRFDDDGNSKFR